MSVPPTHLQYGSIPLDADIEQQGTLYTPNGPRQVSRQDFSQFQKHLVKGLFGFSAVNLVIGGAIVGYAAYSGNEAAGWSMPFFANSVLGLFALIIAKKFTTQEAIDSLSL